jgi:uncharacterized protein (TIGR03000 family)
VIATATANTRTASTTATATTIPSVQPESAPIAPNLMPGLPNERATITVRLPAGATLYVDERKSSSTEAVRSFSTPPLPAGKEFAYLMKAEVLRDGRPEALIQKVPFRAGERITVDFTTVGATPTMR